MKDWHRRLLNIQERLPLKDLCDLVPEVDRKTVVRFCYENDIKFLRLKEQHKEWREYVINNGHKHTIKELLELFPNVGKDRLRGWCNDNGIRYIRQFELKNKTPKKESQYFNVTEHETWLI